MLTTPSRRSSPRRRQHGFGNHEEFLSRISKSLYYVKLPATDCNSFPVTELAAEMFSESKGRLSLDQLSVEEAASLSHNACASPCSLVLALLYLDRLKASNPKYLAKVSPSELFLISLMVGSKFLQDDGEEDEVYNCAWAASAGLTVQDVNQAEKEFLRAIKWEVFVSKEEFWRTLEHLECRVGLRQGSGRGWFSYSELEALLDGIDVHALLGCLATVTFACIASYIASVLAMLGSAFIVCNIPGLVLVPPAPTPAPVESCIQYQLKTNSSCQQWNCNSPPPMSSLNLSRLSQSSSSAHNLLLYNQVVNLQGWSHVLHHHHYILEEPTIPTFYHPLTFSF